MNRRTIVCIVLALCCGTVFAASKTYKYKCPRCKLIQEYGTQGIKKCPNDGTTMQRIYP